MRTVVRILPTVLNQLVKLNYDRVPNLPDAILRAETDVDEVGRVLKLHGGAPPEAIVRPRGPGGVWWLYANGVWIGYTQDDQDFGWPLVGWTVRTITVVAAGRPADV